MFHKNIDGSVSAELATNENERIDALNRTHLLDSNKEEVYDSITRLACKWLDVPIAAISLVDKNRQWFKASCGLGINETSRDISFCSHTILEEVGMVIPDTTKDARFASNPLVTGDPNIRFYAGAPIIIPDGLVLGTLCVIDTKPREDFVELHRRTLEDLAHIVSHIIETRVLYLYKA